MTEQEKIRELVQLRYENANLPSSLYHYTDDSTFFRILKDDCISLRMRNIKELDDKFEGKACDAFLDSALKQLYSQGKVSTEACAKIRQHNDVKRGMLFARDGKYDLYATCTYETYIACFSTKKNDSYMVENYIKNDKHIGCCIEFDPNIILNYDDGIQNSGYMMHLLPVIYGNKTIEVISTFIMKVIEVCDGANSDFFSDVGIRFIRSKVDELRYTTKLYKYHKENEVRLVLHVATSVPEEGCKNKKFEAFRNDSILLFLDKHCYKGIGFYNMDNYEEEKERNFLKKRHYY